MKRRDFVKTTAAGSAFIFTSGALTFNSAVVEDELLYCYQSERKIPILCRTDVVVVGGSLAAVASATEASKAGAKVFLVTQEPYLGEDICGTFRLWVEDKSIIKTSLGSKIFGSGLPTPLHVKYTLDNELVNNDIDFLYSSYVTDIIKSESGEPAGVVIANRSGRQAIIAKIIIDATPRALCARLAGAPFDSFHPGKKAFHFTVVGNDLKKSGEFSAEVKSDTINLKLSPEIYEKSVLDKEVEIQYQAIEYTLQIDMKDNSYPSFAKAEQISRDLTWDPNQVEASDLLFQNPPDKLIGKQTYKGENINIEKINLEVFQPKSINNLFVLSGCASLSEVSAQVILEPGKLIQIGERVGKQAAYFSSRFIAPKEAMIKGEKNKKISVYGDVAEILDEVRPSMNIGEILSEETVLPVLGSYDVVVMGGGTAGAPAAVGAAKNGAKTLVLEYLHGMGGTGTYGMIGKYYHGYRKGYTNIVDQGVHNMGGENHPRKKNRLAEWVFDWKTEYFRKEIRESGGDIWFGVLGVGAYVEDRQVKGVVVATPEGKGVVLAHTIIDSTGSADIAIAAGAEYSYTDGNSVAIQGAGIPFKNPNDFYNNSDWTFIDDSDIVDIWRAFIVAKDKFKGQYDIGKLPQTRERRRIIGDFTISVLDIYNGRKYPDTISAHLSCFDTHGFTIDPFLALKPPAHSGVDVLAFVPLRALTPKGLEGIIVTGLGASAHRDAMPVIRMQPCLQNQGYAVGMGAAMASWNKQMIRYIDIKALQERLVEMENLPEHVLTDQDNYPPSYQKIQEAAELVVNDLEGLETVL